VGRERLYIWIFAIIGGLIFIFSNLFWLLPFLEDVEAAAQRYQYEIAQRISGQAQFFLEKQLRALGGLVIDLVEVDLNKKKTETIIKKFLERQPQFLGINLTEGELAPDQYFLSPVFMEKSGPAVLLRIPVAGSDLDVEGVVSLADFISAIEPATIGQLGRVLIEDNQGNGIFGGHPDPDWGEVARVTVVVPNMGWLVTVADPVIEAWANKFRAINLAIVLMLVGMVFVVILMVNFRKILNIALREKQLSRAKSEYLALMAHQLRTPLAATKWNIKTLLEGDWGSLNKKQKKFLERSYESNEQMVKLVDDLLNITRIEEGRFGYKFVKTDLAQLLEKLVAGFRHQAQQARVVLFFRRPKKPFPRVAVDPEKLNMALSNLLDNAIRYNHLRGRVEVNLEKVNSQIKIVVKDTGVGIPAKQINRLFSKFFRADNVVKLQVVGFGLGLYLVKNIVEKHRGYIEVESKEGEGSVFTITLPIK